MLPMLPLQKYHFNFLYDFAYTVHNFKWLKCKKIIVKNILMFFLGYNGYNGNIQ